ncbi:MAG: hypothetical protein PW844_10195 [Pantoea sp.]|uniref:hypothetical protein n=1 Tax=Pantoea sp. TaxID=69393 RepID=UPI0023850B69|nr:hypothetical protein [Pantoea sp.]MDE1186838.1 hypothetical protein [Pantoea sp.]
MNTISATSTRPVLNTPLNATEQSTSQMSEHLISINNDLANLSSLEHELQQTFSKEILIQILRRLHPTRQVGHPWQHLLPERYSQLLQHSAKLTSVENARALLEKLPDIQQEWQRDAINAISENFIMRIDNFNTFCFIINFLISDNTLNQHHLELLVSHLMGTVGKIISSDIIFQADRAFLTEDAANPENDLTYEEKIIHSDLKLQDAQNLLFFHKVRRIHWDIKYANIKDESNADNALKNIMIKTFDVVAKRYNEKIIKIDQDRKQLLKLHRDDAKGSQEKIKKSFEAINRKIKTFNDSRHHHINLINRHAFEILSDFIAENRMQTSNATLEKIQLKLARTIGDLHKQQRHIALYAMIQKKQCNILVLAYLANTINDAFYQHPYDAMQLFAGEMETQHKNNQNVSPVINAIKANNKKEPQNIWWRNMALLSPGCQKLLQEAFID